MIPILRTLAGAALISLATAVAGQDAPRGLQVPGGTVIPTPPGVVPWEVLQQAKTVQKADRKFGPQYTAQIRALDQKTVRIFGFMMPLEQSREQKRFLLASFPPHCPFCLPGGPESMVEVIADKPVEFTYEPVTLSGKLAVLDDDVVYYRLTQASAVGP